MSKTNITYGLNIIINNVPKSKRHERESTVNCPNIPFNTNAIPSIRKGSFNTEPDQNPSEGKKSSANQKNTFGI